MTVSVVTRWTTPNVPGSTEVAKRCAVDAEGEVLDVLVQSKRDQHAALQLMRKRCFQATALSSRAAG